LTQSTQQPPHKLQSNDASVGLIYFGLCSEKCFQFLVPVRF
jgi:hypothetical protein